MQANRLLSHGMFDFETKEETFLVEAEAAAWYIRCRVLGVGGGV